MSNSHQRTKLNDNSDQEAALPNKNEETIIHINDTSTFIENQNIKNLVLFKIVSALVLGLGCLTIAFSRLVLGAHSINQVVWGLILGSSTGYVWTTQIRPVILRDLEEMRV